MLRDEVWATIAKPEAVRCDPVEPDLFSWANVPCFQQVETFLCFGCIERRLGRKLTQEDLATSVWNAGWIDHVDDRERYGAHERSLALSIEETRKALGAWPALTPALKCASARERHGRFTGGRAMINSTDASRAQPPSAGRSGLASPRAAPCRDMTRPPSPANNADVLDLQAVLMEAP